MIDPIPLCRSMCSDTAAHHAMNRHIERHLLLCFRDNDQVRIGVYNHAIADV